MKTKNACILLLAALTMTACKYDDSALWEQVNQNTERIAALETWQAETNTNIQSLQTLLNTTDYITTVTPVMENGVEVGYTISFLNSDPITIYHGQKGDKGDTGDKGDKGDKGDTGDKGDKGDTGATPQIGVTQGEDGNWYWTLNGELLTDADGNPIRANGEKGDKGDTGDAGATGPQGPQGEQGEQGEQGDTGATGPAGTSAPVPQLSTGSSLTTQGVVHDAEGTDIVADAIYLSVDGGNTWYRVSGEDGEQGDKGDTGATGATGDSFFSNVDISDPTCVTFTLADGTTFSVPRYTGIKVNFGEQSPIQILYGTTETINFTAEGSDNFTPDNLFIVAPYGWKAEVAPTTRALSTAFTLTVTAPTEAQLNAGTADAEGEILVMLDNGQGSTTIGRLKVVVNKSTMTDNELTAGALQPGELATIIGERTDLTSITVTSGTLDETDWAAIKQSNGSLVTIDLARATYEGTGKDNLAYSYNGAKDLPLLTVQLPQGVTGLGDHAFRDCTSLTSINLPEGLTTIGDYAFTSCTSLPSIDLPDGLESIGNNAFAYCKALKSIDLPDGLKSIELGAFRSCTSLTSIDLPDGLESIGNLAFTSCSSLTSITLPETLTSIGQQAFSYCGALTTIDLPDGLESIGNSAFNNCKSLTSITLPDKVTSIGEYAFNDCTSLKSIDLPDGLESIGNRAFYHCNSLTSITLPDKVTSIGESAFNYCTSLTTVTCQATEVPDLGVDAFKNCSKLDNIYVPAEAVTDYQGATNWNAYSTQIQAIP